MKSYTDHAVTLFSAFKSALRLDHKVTGPPKLPQELERRIFETCALENPEVCTVLMLVARRVHVWLDPILISTVCITQNFESKRRDQLERFLVKLANGKPVEYYAQHIKNLAILGGFFEKEVINRILGTCTGVENLVVLAPARGVDFFENPQAGRDLRRLTIKLENFSSWPFPNFNHSCFSNLTHLHLSDDNEDWPAYIGWGNLTSLTHLAFSCAGPDETLPLVQRLPAIQYVALGHYCGGERYKYAETEVNNEPRIRAAWGVRIVFLSEIPWHDWERGARGGGDFWDVVEQEMHPLEGQRRSNKNDRAGQLFREVLRRRLLCSIRPCIRL
ncbi:hypothetical protein K443DRAFT_362825 [Laccaria amethystina LaAM-08-1]|uniref:F-box domain-containing protein n=1 Tax=Laccaria amethystina LaAM-08-1 TaxID=1095629 RepID=A0A0C9WJA6_9AGAR|nr:hypothetical protein K443DRAFT_362825 [Laccaria amethystina LaAM-08-1]